MKWPILLFALVVCSLLKAQEITVFGLVQNSEGDSLPLAIIRYGNSPQNYVRTNKNGQYNFKVQKALLKEIRIVYTQHKELIYQVTAKDFGQIENNSLALNFMMMDNVLGTVIVGSKIPVTYFMSQEFSVADFEIDKQNSTVLLTYPKKLEKGSDLKLLDQQQKVIDTYHFSGRAIELTSDYRKNIHLITKEHVYLVVVENDKIKLIEEDKGYYFQYVAPIIDTLNDNIYYSNFSEIYPAFNYFQFNKSDSGYTALIAVINEPLMEQYRAEFKFSDVRTRLWAANKEIQSGIDKEVWVGAAVFSNSIYYEPLYAPLFINNDSLFVFDHYKNMMFKYNKDLTYSDSVSISYHENARKTGWEQPLIQDKESARIYVLFERDGYSYLSLIDLETGQVKYSRKLYYRYIEKLKIIDNQIFYIYRPFESLQKKHIYKEFINF